MRLIRKKNVADSILSYDFLWERADSYYKDTYWNYSGIINDYIKKIINDYSLLPYYKSNTSTAARLEGEAVGISIEINTTLLLEYLNHLHKLKTTIVQDKEFYRDIEKSAERLIDQIKKRISPEINIMEVHSHSHPQKKMDPLFLGVSHVISCCILRISGREPSGT
ncbi:MAG: hypothetical protein IPO53_08475 [Chitinophagaceae bacterium]|nr:hypothetical protein [Chitinophagaceae bacterium]